MPQEIARQWFVPGEGIDRHVISADIQRYLGNDATVRPGENNGQAGFWIKAYRNLTSAMIADLRADSARWRQEQRVTGTREPYVGSSTYQQSSAGRPQRRDGDSPVIEGGPYNMPAARDRMPQERRQPSDAMDIDRPVQQDRRYGGQPARGYQPENPGYPQQDRRGYPQDNRAYQPDQSMSDAYGRGGVTSSHGQDPRFAPNYLQPGDTAPSGFVRQGQYYVPVTSGYEQQAPAVATSRMPPAQYETGYGQPAAPQGRGDPRDPRYGQSDYVDPRYAYPSPAATVSSVNARDREPISNPPQPSPYGTIQPQYDQYGRPVPNPTSPYGQPEPVYPPSTRDPGYGARERQPTSGSGDTRDARRRRVH